jgi:hypothetical protein
MGIFETPMVEERARNSTGPLWRDRAVFRLNAKFIVFKPQVGRRGPRCHILSRESARAGSIITHDSC